jgi:molybdopterin/thiamine biosynthesis adenylyltransferase
MRSSTAATIRRPSSRSPPGPAPGAGPYVIAAALRYGGNVFAAGPDDACYACLFEDPPTDAATCGEAGVLGPVVGWVGGVAAQATLALLGGARGASIWVLDDLRRGAARTVALARRADCAACEAR